MNIIIKPLSGWVNTHICIKKFSILILKSSHVFYSLPVTCNDRGDHHLSKFSSYPILTTISFRRETGSLSGQLLLLSLLRRRSLVCWRKKYDFFLASPFLSSSFFALLFFLFSPFLNDCFERKNGNDSLQPICCLNNYKEKNSWKSPHFRKQVFGSSHSLNEQHWNHLFLSLSLKLENQSDWQSHFTRKRMWLFQLHQLQHFDTKVILS